MKNYIINSNRHSVTLLLAFILCSIKISAQDPSDFLSNVNPKVETLANALINAANLPGLSIAVSKHDKIIFARGYGYADVENKIKMNAETQLRTASVAKVITITAIGKLVSENKLDLDAPIKNYIPYIDEKYAHITSRQLAGHTSGLEHRPKGSRYKKKQYSSIKETVELMDTPLLFNPDTDYKYSTFAFNVLAAVIEGASGKLYMDYLNQEIFSPLGMKHTFAENINTLTEKDAKLYNSIDRKLKKERLTNASYKIPGAGFRSTPSDLVVLMNAYKNDFISNEVIEDMFRSHTLKNNEKTNVGIAWRSSIDIFGNPVIEHAGNWLGARTVIVYYPKEELSISIMINASCQILIEETAHIFAHLFIEKYEKDFSSYELAEKISLTFNSTDGEKKYEGNFSFKNQIGSLKTNSDNFLNSNSIYYLDSDHNYVMVTKHGFLYLDIVHTERLKGQLFLYNTRQSTHPKKEKPIATFTTMN